MTTPKTMTGPNARDTAHDRRTELVKDMMAKENALSDAKTAKLRALRLARDAEAAVKPEVRKKRG